MGFPLSCSNSDEWAMTWNTVLDMSVVAAVVAATAVSVASVL